MVVAVCYSESFGLDKQEAATIIKDNMAVLSQWRDYYREAGISENDIKIIEPCFHLVDETDYLLDM